MICLTGDIHHFIGNPVQLFYEESEACLAHRFLKIASHYDVKVTLFITGKAMLEDWQDVEGLIGYDNLEIGGHTWSAYTPRWLFKTFKLISGSIYGPKVYQSWDIKRTLAVIKARTGKEALSWRSHAYQSTRKTYEVLGTTSVKVVSDLLSKDCFFPTRIKGSRLISLPINVLPDHEHVYYGTPTRIAKQERAMVGDVFTHQSYSIGEYTKLVIKRIEQIESQQGIATLLLHPQTMYLVDKYQAFERICRFIQRRQIKTIWCQEAVTYFKC